jgi:hypothetical protein
MWLALALGIWVFSLLCIRRYEKNLIASFLQGFKTSTLFIASLALLALGVFLWTSQPFVDSDPDFEKRFPEIDVNSNLVNNINASAVTYRLRAISRTGRLHGIAEYTIDAIEEGQQSLWLNCGYDVKSITFGDEDIKFKTTKETWRDSYKTYFTLPAGSHQKLTIEYFGYPTMLRCFAPWTWGAEITKEHVSFSNGASVPEFWGFSAPEVYKYEIVLPGNLRPVVNHKLLTEFNDNSDGTKTWTGERSGGSPRLWLTAADYNVESFNAGGMEIDFVYSAKYKKIMEEYNIKGAIADVFNYCTKNLGPLSWAGDKLLMVQRSEISGGGNAGDGWVEWGEFIFTPANLDDPLKGASAAEVFIHEIVHQWWGGLGVYCGYPWNPGNKNLWSDEGLTVYTTYRIIKDKHGDEYAKKHYIDEWQSAVDIQNRGFYFRNPEYLDRLPVRYRNQLLYNFTNTNLYCRMPLMILKAEQLVGGEEKMDEILQRIQREYVRDGNHFTFEHFLEYCGLKEEDLLLEGISNE